MHPIAIHTPVRTRTNVLAVVSAHSTLTGRVFVQQWHEGWQCWMHGKWVDAAALTILETVEQAA